MHYLKNLLTNDPFFALFLTITLGFFIGKFRVKTFVLGGIAGSLIMGVIIGQFNIQMPNGVGTIFFALFIYAVGYQGGPQFFRSLNRNTVVQLISASLTCIFGLVCVLIAAYWYHLDRGTAAGLAAGALTQSAMIGTASDAIAKLGLPLTDIKAMQANVAVGYAVCYIFGSFGPILMLTAIFPAMMRWDIRSEAKKLARSIAGGNALLEPGQFQPIDRFDTRVFQIAADSPAVGRTPQDIFEHEGRIAIEALIRDNELVDFDKQMPLRANDIVAVTAKIEAFSSSEKLFQHEVAKPFVLQLTEEERSIILTNKKLDGKTIDACYHLADTQDRYGIFIRSVIRLGEKLTPDLDLVMRKGDQINFIGRPKDLDLVTNKLGKMISKDKVTNFIAFGLGMALGILLGLVTVHVFGIALALGTGGGCLFSGLFFGWLQSRRPQLGTLPVGASNFLRDFGLAVFVATVGISAGPEAVTTIKKYGIELFLLGIGVTIIPQIITFYISYYLLKIKNPIVLLATIAGGKSANPGFAALLDKAGNSTPVVPFTATYAVANILLTLWGPVIIGLVATNIT